MSNLSSDLNDMLREGTDDQSPASPAQSVGQQDDLGQQQNATRQQTEEEVEFNKLTGSSRERFNEMFRRAREAEEKLSQQQQQPQQYYVPQAPNTINSDQRQAVDTLSRYGITTDEKLDRKLAESENRLLWNFEQNRLEAKYSGESGEPKYVREEVEDYIRNHPQYGGYAAEDVFRYKMFPDEFDNLKLSGAGLNRQPRTSSLRPTRSQTRQESLTPEYIEKRLKEPDGQQFYDENLEEINKVVANHTRQFNNDGTLR